MEQYVKGFKGFTPVKMCGLSPLARFYYTEDRNEIKALASKLKEQYEYLLSKLNSDTENKNCEKYSQMPVKCVNDTVGGSNKI